jgi:hypothetical protein
MQENNQLFFRFRVKYLIYNKKKIALADLTTLIRIQKQLQLILSSILTVCLTPGSLS